MTLAGWAGRDALSLAIYLDGSDDPDRAEDGTALLDDDFLVLFNAWWETLEFEIPRTRDGQTWQAEIDSHDPPAAATMPQRQAGDHITVVPRSLTVLRGPRPQASDGAGPGEILPPDVPPCAAGRRFARRLSVHSGRSRKRESLHTSPLSIYSASGDLRQDPGRAA